MTTPATLTSDELGHLLDTLDEMTTLARQWERFSGAPDSTTPEIHKSEALIEQMRARIGAA